MPLVRTPVSVMVSLRLVARTLLMSVLWAPVSRRAVTATGIDGDRHWVLKPYPASHFVFCMPNDDLYTGTPVTPFEWTPRHLHAMKYTGSSLQTCFTKKLLPTPKA